MEAFWDPTPALHPAPGTCTKRKVASHSRSSICVSQHRYLQGGAQIWTPSGPARLSRDTLPCSPAQGLRGRAQTWTVRGPSPGGRCYHLSSAWDPRSPLLLLVFLRLVYHREAPAAEKEQVGSLDNPDRPHSPEAWARAGDRVQGLRQAQHIPASVSSSHSRPPPTPASLPGLWLPTTEPYPPETSRHSQGLRGECQKPKSSDRN